METKKTKHSATEFASFENLESFDFFELHEVFEFLKLITIFEFFAITMSKNTKKCYKMMSLNYLTNLAASS